MALTPAIFLDKDGTVLGDVPYNVDPEKMIFAPGAEQGLARLAQLRLPLIVITNQPGIALGKFGFDELYGMRTRLSRMFETVGATLSGFYFCPHHPDGTLLAYAHSCACRKPAPGLLITAAERHQLDLHRSWLIGDIVNDIEAGRRAGCRTVLVDNGNETEWLMNEWRVPDYCVPDLDAASKLVARQFMPEAVLP